MEKEILISVIMPVYNSARYLPMAIESVLNQTYPFFELLLIDDGSTDESAEICDMYKRKDARVYVFHQNNKGVCSARNIGIKLSKGQYVSFIDNDDKYDKKYLEMLIALAKNEAVDVIKCGRKNIKIKPNLKVVKISNASVERSLKLNFLDFAHNYYAIKEKEILGSVWNGMYRKSFIEKNKISFNEELIHGNEDLIFNLDVFSFHPNVTILPEILYIHYYRISHSTSAKFFYDQVLSRIQAIHLERQVFNEYILENDQLLIEFEGIRECFRIIAQSNDKKIRKQLIKYIEKKLDFDVLNKKDLFQSLKALKKIERLLFKYHLYGIYFGCRKIQKIFEN